MNEWMDDEMHPLIEKNLGTELFCKWFLSVLMKMQESIIHEIKEGNIERRKSLTEAQLELGFTYKQKRNPPTPSGPGDYCQTSEITLSVLDGGETSQTNIQVCMVKEHGFRC